MDEILNNTVEQSVTKVLIALTKKNSGHRILVASMDGHLSDEVDGIYVEQDGKARIFSLNEKSVRYGIDSPNLPSDDIHYEQIVDSFGGMDGQKSTSILIDIFHLGKNDAAVEASEYGWLPEAGEFELAVNNLEAFNTLAVAAGGNPLSERKYWLAQRRNAKYAWFYDVAHNGLGSWLGGGNQLLIRPVKSAAGYEEEV